MLGCFRERPNALKKLLFTSENARALAEICQWLADEHRPFIESAPDELERAAGHPAHGGVVALTERPPPAFPKPSDFDAWRAAGIALLFAEDIADPIQIGGIARVAAAMGVKRLLLGGVSAMAVFSSRAWSAAAGALDLLTLHDAGDTGLLLRTIREKFCVVGFTRPGGRRIDGIKPVRVPGRPLAIVIGNTETGISAGVAGKCEHLFHIPGAEGSTLLNANDTAAFGLPWLLGRERKTGGFLAKKRERQSAQKNKEVEET